MTVTELVSSLRAIADRIEANPPPESRCCLRLSMHGVNERDTLAAWVRLMDNPAVYVDGGSQWVQGTVCDTDATVTAFYRAGLLSRTKRVRIVDRETQPDLAGLLGQPVPVVVEAP